MKHIHWNNARNAVKAEGSPFSERQLRTRKQVENIDAFSRYVLNCPSAIATAILQPVKDSGDSIRWLRAAMRALDNWSRQTDFQWVAHLEISQYQRPHLHILFGSPCERVGKKLIRRVYEELKALKASARAKDLRLDLWAEYERERKNGMPFQFKGDPEFEKDGSLGKFLRYSFGQVFEVSCHCWLALPGRIFAFNGDRLKKAIGRFAPKKLRSRFAELVNNHTSGTNSPSSSEYLPGWVSKTRQIHVKAKSAGQFSSFTDFVNSISPGDRLGGLRVLDNLLVTSKNGRKYWCIKTRCLCGTKVNQTAGVLFNPLKGGLPVSCGCALAILYSNGNELEVKAWLRILKKQRSGTKVSPDWMGAYGFERFRAHRPIKGVRIRRKNPNGPFNARNCYWECEC